MHWLRPSPSGEERHRPSRQVLGPLRPRHHPGASYLARRVRRHRPRESARLVPFGLLRSRHRWCLLRRSSRHRLDRRRRLDHRWRVLGSSSDPLPSHRLSASHLVRYGSSPVDSSALGIMALPASAVVCIVSVAVGVRVRALSSPYSVIVGERAWLVICGPNQAPTLGAASLDSLLSAASLEAGPSPTARSARLRSTAEETRARTLLQGTREWLALTSCPAHALRLMQRRPVARPLAPRCSFARQLA